MNEEIPRSLSLNDAPAPSPALIVGAKVALNSEGKLAEAEWKALAERLSMYSDKRYETARYFFVKDGTIVRQVAVSSQTPSATLAFPDEGYHWKLREWALDNKAKIVFCHNHPSGYTAPSEADEKLTSRLSNFFNGDGEEVFLGHVILDHGSFGLYTPESGWKHFGPRGLEEFGKDEGGFFIRNWTPDLSRKGTYFPVANERGLLLLAEKARELDALDSWNSKDWVPAILASKGGEIRSMEYANVAELKAPDLLLSRMKEAGRLHGAGDLYLFPTNWDQAMLCRSFAAETNAVRGVCRLSESGEPNVSFHANAELFGAPKKSEIIVDDTEEMPEAKARLEMMKENERMEEPKNAVKLSRIASVARGNGIPANGDLIESVVDGTRYRTEYYVAAQPGASPELCLAADALIERYAGGEWEIVEFPETAEGDKAFNELLAKMTPDLIDDTREGFVPERSEFVEPVPELKTYHTLKEEDVNGLEIISDEDFSDIIDSIILNDYKHIPNAIRLPNLNEQLAEKLGLAKDSAFILKKNATHIRPDRKGGYGQAFDTEEYRKIPEIIRSADFVVIDNVFQNFQIVFDDENDESKINKLVFNKDELGNYLVTLGKVDRESTFSEERNTIVAVGVAPTIQTLRTRASSTALRASSTMVNQSISQDTEKSSGLENKNHVQLTKLNFVLDKLSKAGIEVVTDKAEFDRILEQKKLVQKMADNAENKNAQRYHTENILQLNRSIGQYKDNFSGQESQEVLEKLDAYLTQIKNAEKPTKADEFLAKIQSIMHVDEENSKTVRHFVGKKESNLRISNHSANAVHARFRPNETSIVIKLSSTKFRPDTEAFLAEFVYESKNLTAEKQQGIINGLKDWLNTGDYTDKNFDKEFYSPSKELYLQMKQEQESGTKFFMHDNEIYGFAHGGKIYLNPDIMNSEAAVHEYTHLWDNYTQRTNPELWQKGKDIFKDTKLWSDVKADPNYGDIAGDDDLILSEVHARICGKMADAVLERIAERDGELKKDAAIDWDREVSEFVAKEFGADPELGQEDYVSETARAELLKEFLSSPMKDLMAGLQITKGRETSGQTKEETVETVEDKLMAKKKEKAPARRKARKPEETTEAREAKAEAAPVREGFKEKEASAKELYAGFVERMREGWASMKEKEEKGEEPEYASFAALFEGVGKSYSKADRVAISRRVAELAGTESPAQASEWLEKEISSEPVRESGEEVPAEGLEEPAPAVQEGAASVPEQEDEPGVDALKKLLLEAQLRNDALNAKVSSLESVIKGLQSQLTQLNAKLGATQGREEPGPVQENSSAAESGYGAPAQGQQAPSPDPNQFSTQTMYRPGIPVPKFGVKVGEDEFDIKEGCRFKELLKNKDNPAMNEIVLERETSDGTIEKVKIPEREYLRIASVHEKFEREKSQYAGDSYEWDYFHKKYGEEMGVDRNRTRMNTAANFLHNFKVWCRAEAENPQDAMRIARDLVNGMNEWEKHRFNAMRNQWPAGGEDYDKMLVHVFEENSKLKGAAITADRRPGGPVAASMIYELNKDDIQLKKGELIPGTNKRVGETVKLAMKFTSLEGRTVATPQMTFEIVGCSKNLGSRNTIILANREKNTRYEVPLDPVREKIVELEKAQMKELKREAAKAKRNALSLSFNPENERRVSTADDAAYGGRGM